MILPTITTIFPNWRDKLKEAEELKLKEINIFPTCLEVKERKNLYENLKKIGIVKIPFVHIRSDMDVWELDLLARDFKTEMFNTHTQREYPLSFNLDKYKNIIYIENTEEPLDEKEINQFAGICLDFSHLDYDRRFKEDTYKHNVKMIEKYGCGCNHISPQISFFSPNKEKATEHHHFLKSLTQLDYLKNYPKRYFSPYLAVEIENSLKEQLGAIEYIKKILPFIK
jgi:hypothetical protein